MKEPTKIKLTDNPENKNVKLTPLPSNRHYDIEMSDDIWIKNENNKQNNSQSIQQLESDKTN
jgi:threonine dehydratase